jgi:hypothetical protein
MCTFYYHHLLIYIYMIKKLNPDNFSAIIFENKTHMVYDKIQPAKTIIKYIDNLIKLFTFIK